MNLDVVLSTLDTVLSPVGVSASTLYTAIEDARADGDFDSSDAGRVGEVFAEETFKPREAWGTQVQFLPWYTDVCRGGAKGLYHLGRAWRNRPKDEGLLARLRERIQR